MQYAAFFNVMDARHVLGSVTFSRSGSTDFTIDITSLRYVTLDGSRDVSVFNHYLMNTFVGEDGEAVPYAGRNLAAAGLGEAMTARMRDDASWPDVSQLYCEFNGSTYSFSYFSDAFTAIRFSNIHTRRLFGFADDFTGSAEVVTGTRLPNFIIEPVLSSITMEDTKGYVYEPTKISAAAMSAGGVQFGLTRSATPLYRDFVQQSETREKTLRDDAVPTHPFTHQLLFESCRSVLPFAVLDGFDDGFNYLFKLRPDGCLWDLTNCKRAGGEIDHALFDVGYRVQQLATFSA